MFPPRQTIPTLLLARRAARWRPGPVGPVDAGARGFAEHALRRTAARLGRAVGGGALPERGGVPVVAPEASGHLGGVTIRPAVRVIADASGGQGQQGGEGNQN